MMKNTSLVLVLLFIVFTACKKEAGPGGKASISGQVEHHAVPIPHSVVYIQYDANELPDEHPGAEDFDHSVTADSEGKYEFTELNKGNYYLYSIGFDEAVDEEVSGGIPVEITDRKQELQAHIPVTEGSSHGH